MKYPPAPTKYCPSHTQWSQWDKFYAYPKAGNKFRRKHEIPRNVSLVMGVAGVLVRDKGHPLQYEAFHMISQHSPGVFLLLVGSGPCAERHLELGSSVKVLGELDPLEPSDFTILLICL